MLAELEEALETLIAREQALGPPQGDSRYMYLDDSYANQLRAIMVKVRDTPQRARQLTGIYCGGPEALFEFLRCVDEMQRLTDLTLEVWAHPMAARHRVTSCSCNNWLGQGRPISSPLGRLTVSPPRGTTPAS